jgi:hypothetical protein
MDIPIIGEGECGLNWKDALAHAVEPVGGSDDLVLKLPSYDEGDSRHDALRRAFGEAAKTIGFKDGHQEVREWLSSQRLVFSSN